MVNRIQRLSSEVANQIAAGEVIERPASVVKELLENSLDAHASVIHIEIEFGGLSLIQISDNGNGIHAEDLPLALAAHATSKISKLMDLYSLDSMGFRGEALASIASVARVSISSKPQNQSHAMMIRNGDDAYSLEPCARALGTTIEVRDLFYNAPVRKKFLKTPRTELLAIEAVIKRFALSAPHVELSLKHNGATLLELPAANSTKAQLLRIKKMLGKAFVDDATQLCVTNGEMELSGWVSGTNYQRSQNDKLWTYVNKRMVKDKLVLHAVKQAYDGVLHAGKFPACVLYLTLPAQEVDVNVHPTKHEVRFQQPRLIHDFISSQIIRAIATVDLEPNETINKQHQPIELRETYAAKPLSLMVSHKNSPWIVINPKVVLAFINKTPFLVYLDELQKQYLGSILRQQNIPFENRPVLVPMTFIVKDGESLLERYQSLLLQFGVVLDMVSEQNIIIRSLPVALPFLNFSLLLEKLSGTKSDLTANELLELMIDCHLVDAHQLNGHQQEELFAYLNVVITSDFNHSWCVHLDIERCREILHV